MRSWKALAGVLILGGVTACGGGGGDAAPLVFSFPPPTAASFASPAVFQYAIAGDCSGAEVHLRGAATAASFGGQGATSVATSRDRILTNCAAAGSITAWQTAYYDANFSHLGAESSSGAVSVATAPWAVPASLKIGDSGTYGSETVYADATRSTVVQRAVYTYAVQPDTASTALLVLTTADTDASGKLLLTVKTTYQLRSDGSSVATATDYQYTTPSPLHLVYTAAIVAPTLAAGASVTLGAGQMVLVPAGTSGTAPNGSVASVGGHQSTIVVPAGSVINVPANATGPADDVVMAR